MKKKRLAALLLLAPIALLTGCGELTSLSLSANWYASPALGRENISGTYEELEYEVEFKANPGDYTVHYENGTYKTTLENVNYTLDDGTSVPAYHYHTEHSITGRFTYKGTPGEEFTDISVGDVWFLSVSESLRPLKSQKIVHNNVPVANPTAATPSLECRYRYTIEYSTDLKKAKYTHFELADENDEVGEEQFTKSIKISSSGTYLDNEQLFFALRGLDMSAKVTFRSIDPQKLSTLKLVAENPSATNDTVDFELIDGDGSQQITQIDAMHVELSYDAAQPGPPRYLAYAKRVDGTNNTYRNVPLQIQYLIAQSLGTMTYKLKKATFNTK